MLRVSPHPVLIQTKTIYEDDVSFERVVKAPRESVSSNVRTKLQLASKDTDGIPAVEFPRKEAGAVTAKGATKLGKIPISSTDL